MEIKCYFLPIEIPEEINISKYTVAVIDVLRATSTITAALYNGCKGIIPVRTIDEALNKKKEIGENVLLCGERDALKIEGFDLENSPQEFTKKNVTGKIIIHTTTNGTIAIHSVLEAKNILITSFLNLKATIEHLQHLDKVILLCAGRLKEFSLEDTLCAGAIVYELRKKIPSRDFIISEAALSAEVLYQRFKSKLVSVVLRSVHGEYLVSKGLKSDIRYCLQKNTHNCLPVFDKNKSIIKSVNSYQLSVINE